jgi:bifunctional UDP-N-acetylglucosamine pyrophosphorylase/glucosamine-1-phosphate N-acetyltransferase
MQAVILAAGLGTRLRPVTADRSKAMVPVLGRPLVERAVLPFTKNGVRDFVFVISSDDAEITSHFNERTSLDITARFVIQEERLGMAHALGLAAPLVHGRFVVSACDSLLDPWHVRDLFSVGDDADAVLSLLEVEPEVLRRSAVVELDGAQIRRIVEKPSPGDAPSNTVSLPHYVFSPRLLELLPSVEPSHRGEYELQDAIQDLIDGDRKVIGIHAHKRLQVSSPEDLLTLTRQLFSDGTEPFRIGPAADSRRMTLVEPFHIEPGAELGDDCEIGPGVFLEAGCHIGDGAVVRRSVVLRGARVAAGETVEDRVVT